MFPETSSFDTSGASQLLQDFYATDRDSFMQFVYESMEQQRGTTASETVTGTDGQDALDGNIVEGATEGDVLVGGAESDTYFISDDLTRVVEETGEGDWDQVVTNRDFTLSDHINSQGQTSEIEKVVLWSDGDIDADLSAATWNTEVYGNSGNNVLTGGTGTNGLYGGAGDDTIYGNDQTDWIADNEGNDIIYGGAGDDVITNGAGDDTISGGSGADEFYFDQVDGAQYDTITDFETGVDTIYITDMDMWNFSITAVAGGTEFTYGVDRSILIEDDVAMSDFVFLSSDAGGGGL